MVSKLALEYNFFAKQKSNEMRNRVAVVGAGYAGLAVVWHLLQKQFDVTVFDEGNGASHASTGLLHPFPGKKATLSWRANEGMQTALALLKVASQERAVFEQSGIMRFATTEEQKEIFGGSSLWMPEGVTVYSRLYLQELKKVCGKAHFKSMRVQNLEELQGFDAIILATGAETLKFCDLPLKTTIGQSLLCKWPNKLPYSLLGEGHITPTEDPHFCQVGSTYEHTSQPTPQKALDLLKKVALFYPPAIDFEIVEVRAGVRIAPKVGYLPLIQKISAKTWVFTGLGSRGLLYHALLAKDLVDQISSSC